MEPKASSELDREIGRRVRARRIAMGMSQTELGTALGVTFQQVQKYEKGTNRISAVRLQHVATALGTMIKELYGDLASGDQILEFEPSEIGRDLRAESRELARLFQKVENRETRRHIIGLVKSVVGKGDDEK